MYAVIFKAEMNPLQEDDADIYCRIAKELRDLAVQKYACVEFNTVIEGRNEMTISYWQSLQDIKRWKQEPEHLMAQALGREKFYKSYQIQVVEVLREYKH